MADVLLHLAHPLDASEAARLGLEGRNYEPGEAITVGSPLASALLRRGIAQRPLGAPVTSPGAATGTMIVYDESDPLPVRGRLAFVGEGVTAEDDPANALTRITFLGGAVSSVQGRFGAVTLTPSDVGADPAGAAQAAVAALKAEGDPFPTYLTQARADALYGAGGTVGGGGVATIIAFGSNGWPARPMVGTPIAWVLDDASRPLPPERLPGDLIMSPGAPSPLGLSTVTTSLVATVDPIFGVTGGFSDTFTGATFGELWAINGQAAVVAGGANVGVRDAYQDEIETTLRYDLRGLETIVQAVAMPTTASGEAFIEALTSTGDGVRMGKSGTDLIMRVIKDGITSETTIAWNGTAHLWWKIVTGTDNSLSFWTSPDKVTWTSRRSVTAGNSPDMSALRVSLAGGHGPGDADETATFDDISVAAAPVAPPVGPPVSGTFYINPNPQSTGGTIYNGTGSLQSAMAAVPAGGKLILDFDGERVEDINVALADDAWIVNAPGRRPWLNGSLRISGGERTRIHGLSVRWTNADPGGHMVKLDGGSPDFAYAEVAYANCYTLLRPGQAIHDWRVHHCWIHTNLGVGSHDGNQDHGLYCSAENPDQNGRVDHNLIENMPRGRNIKIGGPSGGGGIIAGIRIDHNTLRKGYGPSNGQVSNGTTNTTWEYNILIDSGATRSLTEGSGSGGGNTYSNNRSDRTTGPATANFSNGGGNVIQTVTALQDFATQGAAGFGHLDGNTSGGGGGGAPVSAYVGRVGTASLSADSNTITVPVTRATGVGNRMVLSLGHGGTGRTLNSVVDNRGNTWTVLGSNVNGSTVKAWLAAATVSTPLQVGDSITLTMSGLVATAGAAVDEFAGVTSNTPNRLGSGVNSTTAAESTLTGALTSSTSTATLLLSVVAFAGTTLAATSSSGDDVLAPVVSAAASSNRGSMLVWREIPSADAGAVSLNFATARQACLIQGALPRA